MTPVRLICTLRPMKRHRPGGRVAAAMLTLCTGCGHRLWSEVRSAGAFRFLAHLDDDEGSATYTEHTPGCPGCGARLDRGIAGTGGGTGEPARTVADRIGREGPESDGRRPAARTTGVGELLAALAAHDGYTGEHSKAVAEHAVAVARRMELPEEGVAEIEQVALLHDMGKIVVGDRILSKPGPLNEAERRIMEAHPAIGGEVVASTWGLSHLAPAVRASHERWDGKGYPDGLSGEEIPLASRIVLACDAFHAMTGGRSYRKALTTEAALGEIRKGGGTQFCPRTVGALAAALDRAEEELLCQGHAQGGGGRP